MAEYIEKQAAIKAVCDACGVTPDGEKDTCPYKYEGAGCREYDKIIDISPADVRPVRRGRWIDYDDDYGAYCCSVCEQNAPEDTEWPYCPHCGADMREADNGKET